MKTPHFLIARIALLSLALLPASAGAAEKGPSLSELREAEARIEEKHQHDLRSLESGITAQSIDPDTASERRFRIEQQYRRDMDAVARARDEAIRAIEAKDASGRTRGSRGPAPSVNNALPRLPSTSTLTFPGAGSGAAEAPTPSRRVRQKNVGVGVRELEY